ncbi:MAG: glycine cleavage system protein GcvH [Deltaproteobacteria bacterium]|nr:glycine cleavage system protein GcvH [Deltaproteobacteria bacterium]
MEFPDNLKYTKDHEWVKCDGAIAVVGITDYAQEQLGDIVYLEFPEEGESVSKGDAFGVVESVKAVSDIYAPVSGEVMEINDSLKESPETLNEDPYGEGWLVRMEVSNMEELDELLDYKAYQAYLREEQA